MDAIQCRGRWREELEPTSAQGKGTRIPVTVVSAEHFYEEK
jgi:hypothetical protein